MTARESAAIRKRMSRYFRIGRSRTGLGMFATRPIKRGAYIATYRGRVIPDEEAERREARGARYMFELTKKLTIDGSPRWNIARYINHSCKPNARPVGRNGGIVIVADRRIEPEEEITYSYGKEYLQYFIESGGCRCDACRKKRARKRRKQRQVRLGARKSRTGARKARSVGRKSRSGTRKSRAGGRRRE
jgi:hypothetical protein